MCLEDRLALVLDEEIKKQNQPEQVKEGVDIEALINKKMSDLELRLNATIEKMAERNNNSPKSVENTEKKGEEHGGSTELSTGEQG